MNQYTYDFHVHTCLSPCGDDEMTPGNILLMAQLAQCEILAVTDHNSCKNVPAVMEAAQKSGVLVIPGMELCTSEEAHVVCLFETLEGAMAFDRYVYGQMPHVKNKPEIFGEQRIYDAADRQIGTEENLLLVASLISADDVAGLTAQYGGIAFPAHIDRHAYSLLTVLGAIPPQAGFCAVELSGSCEEAAFRRLHPELSGMRIVRNSDAHSLEALAGLKESIALSEKTRSAVLDCFKAEKPGKPVL